MRDRDSTADRNNGRLTRLPVGGVAFPSDLLLARFIAIPAQQAVPVKARTQSARGGDFSFAAPSATALHPALNGTSDALAPQPTVGRKSGTVEPAR